MYVMIICMSIPTLAFMLFLITCLWSSPPFPFLHYCHIYLHSKYVHQTFIYDVYILHTLLQDGALIVMLISLHLTGNLLPSDLWPFSKEVVTDLAYPGIDIPFLGVIVQPCIYIYSLFESHCI